MHQQMLVQRMRWRAAGPAGRHRPRLSWRAAGYAAVRRSSRGRSREVGQCARQDRWPDVAARELGDALSTLLPLVQVPPRGLWRQNGAGPEHHHRGLARSRGAAGGCTGRPSWCCDISHAYGPAASADVRAWCRTHRSARRRSSGSRPSPADVPRRARPRCCWTCPTARCRTPDTPAPPRFLPAFDNAVLGYDDRSRIIDAEHRGLSVDGRPVRACRRPSGGDVDRADRARRGRAADLSPARTAVRRRAGRGRGRGCAAARVPGSGRRRSPRRLGRGPPLTKAPPTALDDQRSGTGTAPWTPLRSPDNDLPAAGVGAGRKARALVSDSRPREVLC